MNCKDLMIGDWYLNSNGDACKVIKNFSTEVWGIGNDISDSTDNPQPIPLTEEILKVNGFKNYTEIYEFHFEDEWDKYRFYLKKMYNKENICDAWGTNIGGVIPSVIMYVHELQHALRLCGLNELADNFKIE